MIIHLAGYRLLTAGSCHIYRILIASLHYISYCYIADFLLVEQEAAFAQPHPADVIMPAPSVLPDKNDLFAQYQILEDLGDFPNYSLFKVKAPNGTVKLWKKVDLQFSAASIETRLLPVIEKVQHPNLNGVSNSFLFQDKGLLFVESEFPVKTLRHRLDEIRAANPGINTGIPIAELFSYIAQAAEAIDFLNTAQHPYQGKKIAIYHRALSPDSLHVFEEKNKIVCKVGDFGLAKPIVDSNEAARHSLGLTNYDYAPPEFDEGMTTNTSDQYSLATTYVELRTGRLPFTGTLLQKLQAQLSGNPDLSLLEPNERPVVARALNRDPNARFHSCKEFIKQLQLALGGVVTIPLTASSAGISRNNSESAAPAATGNSLFGSGGGGGNSGWALSARPVGRSGGSLFNVPVKGPINTPAKPEGFSLMTPNTQASAPAPSAPAPAPKAKPTAVPALPDAKAKQSRQQTPVQAEGWSVDTPSSPSTPALPATPSNWTPGKVTASTSSTRSGSKPGSLPDVAVTPPPAAGPKESISPKARETLELIKKKQAGPSSQAVPPSVGMDKQVPGSKFLNVGSGSFPSLPALPSKMPPRGASKTSGALGETPAPVRPSNIPAARRASTPNMGVPLPNRQTAQPAVSPRQAMQSPVPLPRRSSAGLPAKPPSADPFEAIRDNVPNTSTRASWVTLVMVSIAAFCIGMLLLAYLARK